MAAVMDNPIVLRELRSRMRGNRALWLQFLYVVVLGAVVLIAFFSGLDQTSNHEATSWLGRLLFRSIATAQGVLMALTAPAFAAGALTSEREQQTIESLLVSPLRTGAIIRGKILAATLFLLLLLTISVPLLALAFLFGGVAPAEVAGTYAVQLANGLLLAAIGLGWSAVCRNTAPATVLTFASVAAYLLFSSMLAALAETGFALSVMCPLVVPFYAAEQTVILGRHMAQWIPSSLAVLLLAIWAFSATASHAARHRDQRICVAPRLWSAVASLLFYGAALVGAVTASAGFGASATSADFRLILAALFAVSLWVAIIGAMVFATGDDDGGARRYGWWAVWRNAQASSVAYVALTPLALWPGAILASRRAGIAIADWSLEAAFATVVAVSTAFVIAFAVGELQAVLRSRWTATTVSSIVLGAGMGLLTVAASEAATSYDALGLHWLAVGSPVGLIFTALVEHYPDPASGLQAEAFAAGTYGVLLAGFLAVWTASIARRIVAARRDRPF